MPDNDQVRGYLSVSKQLTIVIHHSGLLFAAVHWEANDLHLHKRIDNLTE